MCGILHTAPIENLFLTLFLDFSVSFEVRGEEMEEYEYSEGFQRKLLALYVSDPQATHGIVEPKFFTYPIHVDIARLVKETYESHNKSEVQISRPTLLAIVKEFLGKKRREVWPGYRKEIRELFSENGSDRRIVLQHAVGFEIGRAHV